MRLSDDLSEIPSSFCLKTVDIGGNQRPQIDTTAAYITDLGEHSGIGVVGAGLF